jgi:PAS domain S-box-containing protein
MPWRGWDLGAGARERVAHTATALLIIRVLEGLAAWLLFNEFFLATAPVAWWAVPTTFVVYFTLNLGVTLYYRAGRASTTAFVIDVLANVVPFTLPLAASGGLASPLLLLFPVTAITYVTVFNARIAWLSLLVSVTMLALVVALGRVGVLPVVRLYEVEAVNVYQSIRVALLCQLVIAPLAIAWLRQLVVEADRSSQGRERLEKDSASLAVANALLTASEALGSLMNVDDVLERLSVIAPRLLLADECSIVLWSAETGRYQRVVVDGSDPAASTPAVEPTAEEVRDFEWVRRLGHCVVVPSPPQTEHEGDAPPALLIAPLITDERFDGVIRFTRLDARRAFTQRDLSVARGLASHAAIALDRARRFEAYQRLARAVESTGQAVVITDAQARVLYVNDAFARLFGYERDEMLGREAAGLMGSSAEWVDDARREIRRSDERSEIVAYRKDGAALPLVVTPSAIHGDDGRVEAVVAIAQDVSVEKSFQAQLQRADRLAAVGEMAAGIAHEINNALTAIFGQMEHADDLDAHGLRRALTHVDRQARRIADIVQGVLGFARPRPLRTEPVDLVSVTQETLDLLQHELQHVSLETRYDSDLPPALADRQQVQQVLLNLLTNARQAMASQSTMRLRITVTGADDRLAIRVTDWGPGIQPDVLPRIFDPFFSTKASGTGLGLSVSYAIARAHGGELTAESEVGKGTTFTMVLPVAQVEPSLPSLPALVVDDEPDVAQALIDMLAKEGFAVECAATGQEALHRLASENWEMVFLDVRLPDLSGPEVYARLRQARPKLAERVIFVTGGVWRSDSRLREQLPARPILAKPYTQTQLRAVLREVRSRQRQAA